MNLAIGVVRDCGGAVAWNAGDAPITMGGGQAKAIIDVLVPPRSDDL